MWKRLCMDVKIQTETQKVVGAKSMRLGVECPRRIPRKVLGPGTTAYHRRPRLKQAVHARARTGRVRESTTAAHLQVKQRTNGVTPATSAGRKVKVGTGTNAKDDIMHWNAHRGLNS